MTHMVDMLHAAYGWNVGGLKRVDCSILYATRGAKGEHFEAALAVLLLRASLAAVPGAVSGQRRSAPAASAAPAAGRFAA